MSHHDEINHAMNSKRHKYFCVYFHRHTHNKIKKNQIKKKMFCEHIYGYNHAKKSNNKKHNFFGHLHG